MAINRFAFVIKGGEVIKIIYNSKNMKLINEINYPLGKFVSKNLPGEEIQQLGPVERLLGIRFIGIPFIHTLLEKKMSWISVEGSNFIERKDQPISTFAITKTFGFNLKELVLGKDSDNEKTRENSEGDDQKFERILVNIKFMLQATIEDPHLAFVATNWVAGVEGKLMRFVQSFLGHTSQDELIEQKAPKKGVDGKATYCQLVQEVIDNMAEIQTYGVTFETEKVTYVDYELAGGTENVARIQAANTQRFEKNQEAAGIRAIKIAEQEDMREQKKILLETIKELTKDGDMSVEQAERIALSIMRTKALAETGLGTLVEGGAGVSTNISTGGSTNSKKKGKK